MDKMSWEVYTSVCLLALFVRFCGAIYEEDLVVHGEWSNTRSLQKNVHISCSLPTAEPVDYFSVTLSSSVPIFLSNAWSVELYSQNNDDDLYMFQNVRRMYPPRIVLNFHFKVYGFLGTPKGTCSFTLLNERLTTTTTTPASTDGRTLFPSFEFFEPGLPIPGGLLRPGTSGSDTEMDPCSEAQTVFPDSRDQFEGSAPLPYDSSITTADPTPSLLRPLPPRLPPIGKRSLLPFPGGNKAGNLLRPSEKVTINYTLAMEMSMNFYAAQRSGNIEKVPQTKPHQWMRSSGTFHSAPDGRDLTGGWYNGNDNVKLTFPMAAATTVLAWGYDTWKDIYISSGLDETFKETIKWPLDYFLKSWDLSTQTLYVQVGNLSADRTLWNRADDDVYNTLWNNNEWPVYSVLLSKTGSDVAAEVVSALALSSLIQFDDDTYSSKLIDTAKEIYQFVNNVNNKYSDGVPVGGAGDPDYTSSGFADELCLAAAVLYSVTGLDEYLAKAELLFSGFEFTGTPEFFSWDDKSVACAIMLYKIKKEDKYVTYLQNFRLNWTSAFGQKTPNGLAWRSEEGTLRHTANAVFILLEGIEAGMFGIESTKEIYTWASEQIDYMLGINGMKRSYLIGYGKDYVRNAYHKNSACSHPAKGCGWGSYNSEYDNKNVLVGALVGGPDLNDFHADNRQNTAGNSVALDYNAGFQSVLAGLQSRKEFLLKECEFFQNDINFDSSTYETSSSMSSGMTPTTPFAAPQPTPVPDKPEVFDYADALRKSILFYAAQRSGTEPENNPIPWRRWDDTDTEASGGWFDDGSAVKTTEVMASAVTILGWGAIKFKAGYEAASALDDLYDSLRWPLDYFVKIWQQDVKTLVRKVGQEAYERAYWARPMSAYENDMEEISVDEVAGGGQGADVAADVATALAIGSVLFKDKDLEYSESLLTVAKQVYTFANQLDDTFSDASSVYYSDPGEDFEDELCVAAWWMYKATQDNKYYNDGMEFLTMNGTNFVLNWNNKDALCQMLIYEYTGSFKTSYDIGQGIRYWTERIKYTPQGLAWHDNESLKFAANGAFIQVLAASYGILNVNSDFHKTQIDYMLGKNNQAFSYQIGYGNRYPRRPHHRASSCPDYMEECDWSVYNSPGNNPHVLIGALVSGPDMNDVYEDVRSNYTMNRVSVEHNAGFQSVLAYLVEEHPYISTHSSPTTTTTTTTTKRPTTQKVTTTTRRLPTTIKQTTKETPTKKETPKPATKPTETLLPKTTENIEQEVSAPENGKKLTPIPTNPVPIDQPNTAIDNGISASARVYTTLRTVLFLMFIPIILFL